MLHCVMHDSAPCISSNAKNVTCSLDVCAILSQVPMYYSLGEWRMKENNLKESILSNLYEIYEYTVYITTYSAHVSQH